MSSSANEDLEMSKDTGMENSDAMMTIEVLRARLLSERSVSKSAKQKVEDLTKRVAELEGHLKYVSFQRKKAEKATADVLAILENSGITDVSEEFDSSSDEDDGSHEFEAQMIKETSKLKRDDVGISGVDSPQSISRSLSWKSTKNSQYSIEKKKYFDSVSKRSSVASNSSSARRVGKSCRRVRRREIRQQEELQNDGHEKATCPTDASNCSDGNDLRESGGCEHEREGSIINSASKLQKVVNGHYFVGRERDEDMETALRHRAQLIGQYEEEEKAQRLWEEKFRENRSAQQDSCDPGIHSDMTEEQYDIKSHELSSAAETLSSNNQETNQEQAISVPSNEEFQTPKSFPSLSDADKVTVQQDTVAHESSAAGFSFPVSDDTNVPSKSLSDLGEVLESLKQAKLSLNQTLSSSSMVSRSVVTNYDSQTNNLERFGLLMASPGLFRLPTDHQHGGHYGFANSTPEIARSGFSPELISPGADYSSINMQSRFANFPPEIATTRFRLDQVIDSRNRYDHYGIGCGSTFPNYSPEITDARFPSEPSLDARSGYSDGRFLTGPTQLSNMSRTRPAVPPQGYICQTTLSRLDPYTSIPDATVRLPFGEGTSRNFEAGLPPTMRLPSYDDVLRRA